MSHCWGEGDFFKVVRENYEVCLEEIPHKSLPSTFKDAIYAAEKLGYEYIWIDSLCIIQRDNDDWAREAATMSNVYAGSDLNIAATLGKNSQSGLFTTRNPTNIVPCILDIFTDTMEHVLVYDPYRWGDTINQSQLGQRGWIFQERVLAPRTLHFGPDQYVLEPLSFHVRRICGPEIHGHYS